MGLRRGSSTGHDTTRGVVSRRFLSLASLTPKRAKRLVGVVTAVAPLLAPYALAGAAALRSRLDALRAARLGVPPEDLGRFSGPGGTLNLRIARVTEALGRLEQRSATTDERGFVAQTRSTLEDLTVAVRTASTMPPARRRTAHRAIAAELDRIESELLARLGVGSHPRV